MFRALVASAVVVSCRGAKVTEEPKQGEPDNRIWEEHRLLCEHPQAGMVIDKPIADGVERTVHAWRASMHCFNEYEKCRRKDCKQKCDCKIDVELNDWSVANNYNGYMCNQIVNEYACPERILQIGLGTGWLTTCVAEHCPNSKQVTVDVNAWTLEIAQNFFGFEDSKTRKLGEVVIQDAGAYLKATKSKFDMVIVDCVDEKMKTIPKECKSASFYKSLKGVLRTHPANGGKCSDKKGTPERWLVAQNHLGERDEEFRRILSPTVLIEQQGPKNEWNIAGGTCE